MPPDQNPELSIIVPIINEAEELPNLLDTLTRQTGIVFELILCDGGSDNEQSKFAIALASACLFKTQYIKVQHGRGRQMNAGASIAKGELLLFLHADSRFAASDAITKAVNVYRHKIAEYGNKLAAHFTLNFRRSQESLSLAYFFYEAKTCLDRLDCIRGDQGFLLSRTFFYQTGRFDESLPYLEDIRLVDVIAKQGQWLTLPIQISTSARRFEEEGLLERQTLNAIIVNSIATGWSEFFSALPGIYQCHPQSGRLQLFPLLDGIRQLLATHSIGWRCTFWLATGRHVAANIWQLFFWLDVRAAFIAGLSTDRVGDYWVVFYCKFVEPITSSRLFAFLTATVVWTWHRIMLVIKPGC